ncbi:MAG: hypothetical protein JW780_08120 [Clostridiales bacterium]|nr:hypothetical protein [Clostridiales bacterium]
MRSRKGNRLIFRAVTLGVVMLSISSCAQTLVTTETQPSKTPEASTSAEAMDPEDYLGKYDEEMAEELIRSVNELRASYGLHAYQTNEDMTDWARIRAAEIIFRFAHFRIDGSDMITAYRGETYTDYYSAISKGHITTQSMLEGWMDLDYQKDNILSDEFTHIGAACLWHNGVCYSVLVFLRP